MPLIILENVSKLFGRFAALRDVSATIEPGRLYAILHDPEILLLDEPFSNLDAQSASHISNLMGAWRDSGKTLLVVTHQASHVEKIADESWLLRGGQLAAQGAGISALTGAAAS